MRRLAFALVLVVASGVGAGAQTITLKRSSLRIANDSIEVRGMANAPGVARMRLDPKLAPALAARCGSVVNFFQDRLVFPIGTTEGLLTFNIKKLPIPSPAHYELVWSNSDKTTTSSIGQSGTQLAEVPERAQQYVCPQAPGHVRSALAMDASVRGEVEKSVVAVTACSDADADGCSDEIDKQEGSGFFINGAGWVVTAARLVKALQNPALRIEVRRHGSQTSIVYVPVVRPTASGNDVSFPKGHRPEDQIIVLKPRPMESLGSGIAFLDPVYSDQTPGPSTFSVADRMWAAEFVDGEVKTRLIPLVGGIGAQARAGLYSLATDRFSYRCQECPSERFGGPIVDALGRVWGVYVGSNGDANPARREFIGHWAHDIVTWFIERAR